MSPVVTYGVPVLAFVGFVLTTIIGLRSKRKTTEIRDRRQADEINIATLAWATKVRRLAAINGWELPALPKEMTLEYIQGKAHADGNPELERMSAVLGKLAGLDLGEDAQ